jgi:hypothetical protein
LFEAVRTAKVRFASPVALMARARGDGKGARAGARWE